MYVFNENCAIKKSREKRMHVFNTIAFLTSFFMLVLMVGCSSDVGAKDPELSGPVSPGAGPDGSPSIHEGFHFQTFQHVSVTVRTDYPGVTFYIDDENGKNLAVTKTDFSGLVYVDISVSSVNKGVYVKCNYVGLPSEVFVTIDNGKSELDLRKVAQNSIQNKLKDTLLLNSQKASMQGTNGFPNFSVLSDWSNSGVPDNLWTREVISNSLITDINTILPELRPVPQFHAQYLDATKDRDIHMIKDGEVFVTFLHEGAGYTNTLGFYTYLTAQGPPTSLNPQDIKIIFPNVSYYNSGGGLVTGDTVKIGLFPAGTSIGWVLIANGYSTRFAAVTNGLNRFHSENSLNRDLDPYKQHFIQIDLGNRIILGVEDLLRPGGDNDFNDAVFSIKSNPLAAIDRSDLITSTEVVTAPPEPEPTPISLKVPPLFEIGGYQFFPGNGSYGALAFEDLWPLKGDYDFNDLVIDYNVVEVLNKSNQIVQLQLSFKVTGILASMHNGFGIQLGVKPDVVASVTGGRYTKGYIELEPNGTQKRQEKAVIIVFEDAQAHFNASNPDQSELLVVTVNFARGVTRNELGFAPYNPYIMSNGEPGREVHLPGYQPTNLVNIPYFGSYDDQSVLGTSYMYRTGDDLPWAIHLPEKFDYPYDGIKITDAYNFFQPWILSNGLSYADWYKNKLDYRKETLIVRPVGP